MRSLSKNVSLLQDILITLKETPIIIAISETKLGENSRLNINIPGYIFVNTNSKTAAGGVGLYVSEELEFSRRRDLDLCLDGVESCWIELPRKRQKSVLIGCVYKHPSSDRDSFFEALRTQLEDLNNKGYEIFISGDINVNFFRYNDCQGNEHNFNLRNGFCSKRNYNMISSTYTRKHEVRQSTFCTCA